MVDQPALRILGLCRSPEIASALRAGLTGIAGTRAEFLIGDLSSLSPELLNLKRPNIAIIDVDPNNVSDFERLETLTQGPGQNVAFIGTSSDSSLELVRKLMRIGVLDFLGQPIASADLAATIEQVLLKLRASGKEGNKHLGRLLSFQRSVGGAGSTTIAIQTAHVLAETQKSRICVLDFDVQFGTAAIDLDVEVRGTMSDILSAGERFDETMFEGLFAKHKSGLFVLGAPREMVALESITPEMIMRTLGVATQFYDYVVVDLPRAITHWTQAVLDNADMNFLVTQLTVAGVHQARRLLAEVYRDESGANELPVTVLLNRYEKKMFKSGQPVREAEKALGRKFDYCIANDWETAVAAQNQGVPLQEVSSRSPMVRSIQEMVEGTLKRLATDSTQIAVAS
jgi:pilus assembly protein CpaE